MCENISKNVFLQWQVINREVKSVISIDGDPQAQNKPSTVSCEYKALHRGW